MIHIIDKEQNHHTFMLAYIKLITFTGKGNIKIVFKDNRSPDVTIKSTQISFE